jgi:hypothetical protein
MGAGSKGPGDRPEDRSIDNEVVGKTPKGRALRIIIGGAKKVRKIIRRPSFGAIFEAFCV